jgi:hypothetical protein
MRWANNFELRQSLHAAAESIGIALDVNDYSHGRRQDMKSAMTSVRELADRLPHDSKVVTPAVVDEVRGPLHSKLLLACLKNEDRDIDQCLGINTD